MTPPTYSLAHKLHAAWIIFRSILVTIRYSIICLYYGRTHQRTEVDRSVRNWANKLLQLVKVTYRVHNPHGVHFAPGHAYILMSNHASLYDIPLIFMALPGSIRMIAKKELFSVPIWGHAMQACEFPAIDRKNSAQALQDLEIVREKMHSGIVPWIAPEGTRSRDGALGVFKKGGFMLAIQTKATIIPISIRGAAAILPPKTLEIRTGQTVDIVIGEPVDATQYTVATRMALLQAVRKQIEEGMKISP